MNEPLSKLFMHKESLADLSALELLPGYSLRHFKPGDEAVWEHIIERSFEKRITFEEKIGGSPYFQIERVQFICRGSEPVATATAWEREETGEDSGYLHMVGALPEYAGQGLGRAVTLAALHKMRSEYRSSATLKTDDFRLAAIQVYWRLGFRPTYLGEDHEKRWTHIMGLIQK
ncbi:GNAT family N-acetyltransferase [Paenibacillus sp. HWE-109]|uniref:GNAT family N-acetyltransferase n=1 Tax=Paenibacillus sp. HWE-109 TaxID=1306526 RepID=UPI001EDDA308|nr:GNAT family N-acetyltransferase [Paenibacillus sp. HWE-109]UKS23825.1 GNAT family N-acetyltransferase [Paenibacillus sp. HWE-109]